MKSKLVKQRVDQEHLVSFMTEYAKAYLACGGSTARVEDRLTRLGNLFGYETDIYGTPTGVFVSIREEEGHDKGTTTLARIKESGMNLFRLCWLEGVFEDVFINKISLLSAKKILVSKQFEKSPYTKIQTMFAACFAGLALSYSRFAKIQPALVCGLITVAAWWFSGPGLKNKISSQIFRDFMGCIVMLLMAACAQFFLPVPFEAYTIGGMIVLVPGLTLTTAIGELADQNLVSGTAKLMQAVLTLLALGIAYILFQDFTHSVKISDAMMVVKNSNISPFVAALSVLISVSCFGILIRVPLKALPWAAMTGLVGWFILRLFETPQLIVPACYFASVSVGLVALSLGRIYKVPSEVFSVPGIIAMLPGMLAFSSFKSFAQGEGESGIELAFRVFLTAGCIVFGLFTARIPFAIKKRK